MLPEFKNAKEHIIKSQEEYFEFAQKQHLGEPFSNIPKRVMPEGSRLKQIYSKTMERQTEIVKIATSFNINKNQMKEDPFIIYEQLFESAKEFAKQQLQMTLNGIADVTALTGNVVRTTEADYMEGFYQSLEKVEIAFDENGKPLLPTMVGGSNFIQKMTSALKKSENSDKAKQRMDKIISEKRKQWYDRENSRKLVD